MQQRVINLRLLANNYKAYDDELRELNTRVYELRNARKNIENHIINILKDDAFKEYSKLKLEDDGSTIQIKRPLKWSKPWALSMKELQGLIDNYFESTTHPTADECYDFIVSTKKTHLLATDFAIVRTVPNQPNANGNGDANGANDNGDEDED
jgi:hypothetical protein